MTGLIRNFAMFILVSVTLLFTQTAEGSSGYGMSLSAIDPSELLEIDAVSDSDHSVNKGQILPERNADQESTVDSPYPIKEWKEKSDKSWIDQKVIRHQKELKALLLSPYYFSAYMPEKDKTEVDLGLVLSSRPGIDISIAWGAMEELFSSARMTVQGASYTTGIQLNYLLRQESIKETKPALGMVFNWRGQNYRDNDEERSNIFRGNRIAFGGVISKDMGSLAVGLEADNAIVNFLDYFRIHVEPVIELQTGRIKQDETAFTRVEFGIRSALEIIIDPERIYLAITYNSLSDWINGEDQYLALRYYSRKDFAIDVIAGWFGSNASAILNLVWIF